ncbi:MAG TPA: tetratricopeptide repeat protein, partial [Steroidobacteraceae bacterium]|nr:tetratricopeptide repeat protein [Steroidobacteraceae bacterium]
MSSATLLAICSQACLAQTQPAPASTVPAADVRQLLDAKQYDAAVAQARQQLAAAEQQPGPGGDYLQVALMNLALAQYFDEDYLGAEDSYLRVIKLIEDSGRRTTARLARAQAGLATTYYAGKRYDLAAARYEQAIALVRREQGLFTEEQLPYLEKYASALTELDRVSDALKVRRYILRTVERKYGASSVQYAQALESAGRWLMHVGSYDAARTALRQSIGIIEGQKGENAGELIGPLTALGECARLQLLDPSSMAPSPDQPPRPMFGESLPMVTTAMSATSVTSDGQRSLERAVAIATQLDPPSPAQVADTRTLLGDWYQSRQLPDKAAANYELAWRAAGTATVAGRQLTDLLFGKPVLIAYVPPTAATRFASRSPDEVVVRNVEVRFTVTSRGRVADAKVLEDAGDPSHGTSVQRALQTAIYRPRFENGVAVDTPGVTLDQRFYVLVDEDKSTDK